MKRRVHLLGLRAPHAWLGRAKMADADEDGVAIPGARVRFGAIGGPDRAALVEGMVKGNIHIAGGAVGDRFALSDGSEQTRERQEELMRELESRRRQRAIAVTTDDGEVRAQLRQHGEPVTLFGEGPGDRRDRLRRILAKLDAADGGALPVPEDAGVVPESQAVAQKEVFYTEGTAELAAARLAIAAFSMPRAEARLRRLRAAREGASGPDPERDPEGASVALASLDADARRAAFLETEASVVGDDRPLCDVRFSKPDGGALILSASWTGAVKLWSAARCEKALAVRASEDRVTGADLHPSATEAAFNEAMAVSNTTTQKIPENDDTVTGSSSTLFMATASADGVACLWSASGTLLREMRGHVGRCGRASFYPSGAFLATAGFDKTWRLWDCETGVELLCQEGHSRAVYDVRFHPDGSLACSVGLEAHGRVWDARSGLNVLNLRGHAKPVLCVDFAPNGAHVVTGSEDHTVKVWDLRHVKGCLYTVPAHSKSVTSVRYEPQSGGYFLSASHDGDAKAWSGADFSLRRRLRGHASRVAAVDVAPGGAACVTVGHDRTLKLWRAGRAEARGGGERMEED